MEKSREWKQKNLISELNRGKDMANQLRNLLQPFSSSEMESFLIEKIASSFEKALSIIYREASMEEQKPINGGQFEPPHSFPTSYKKRKLFPHRSEQVKVSAGTELEGSLDDGYSWRKYGQKDILGASFPRGYYRCRHRHSQGCLATKQVQRSDEDPNIFQITYAGRHTCSQTPEIPQELRLTAAGEGLQVKTEDINHRNDHIFPIYGFPSPSTGNEESNFTEPMMENLFGGSISPAISGFSGIISPPTSISNSPMGEFEFSLDKFGIGLDFPFHDLKFIS